MRTHLNIVWAFTFVVIATLVPQVSSAEDTVEFGSAVVSVGAGAAVIPVTFTNDVELAGLEITLTWDSPDVHIDSFSFVGGRVGALSTIGWSTFGSNLSIYAVAFSDLIPTGTGLLGTAYFGYPTSVLPQTVTLDTVTFGDGEIEYSTNFSDADAIPFAPQIAGGTIEITESGCCINDRGNVDNDPLDAIDISDLIYLVNYMFQEGEEPVCMEEANVDGEGEPTPDISDLIYLVNYMFQDGEPPLSCF